MRTPTLPEKDAHALISKMREFILAGIERRGQTINQFAHASRVPNRTVYRFLRDRNANPEMLSVCIMLCEAGGSVKLEHAPDPKRTRRAK